MAVAAQADTGVSVSVMLVDDSPAFVRAARSLIESVPGFHVVGEAASGEQAVDGVRAAAPDLVLMDVRMPGIGGIEATRRIHSMRVRTTVVLVSSEDATDLPASAQTCGAAAFMTKTSLAPATVAGLRELVG